MGEGGVLQANMDAPLPDKNAGSKHTEGVGSRAFRGSWDAARVDEPGVPHLDLT